jgi:hypothetical protein
MPIVGMVYYDPFNPSITLPYPVFKQLSIHILISSTYTYYVMYITNALSFSFLFPLSLSSVEQFYCCKHVLHLSLYMNMLAFVYMFISGSIFHV